MKKNALIVLLIFCFSASLWGLSVRSFFHKSQQEQVEKLLQSADDDTIQNIIDYLSLCYPRSLDSSFLKSNALCIFGSESLEEMKLIPKAIETFQSTIIILTGGIGKGTYRLTNEMVNNYPSLFRKEHEYSIIVNRTGKKFIPVKEFQYRKYQGPKENIFLLWDIDSFYFLTEAEMMLELCIDTLHHHGVHDDEICVLRIDKGPIETLLFYDDNPSLLYLDKDFSPFPQSSKYLFFVDNCSISSRMNVENISDMICCAVEKRYIPPPSSDFSLHFLHHPLRERRALTMLLEKNIHSVPIWQRTFYAHLSSQEKITLLYDITKELISFFNNYPIEDYMETTTMNYSFVENVFLFISRIIGQSEEKEFVTIGNYMSLLKQV